MSWEPQQQRRIADDPVATPAPASAGVMPALETPGPAALDSRAVLALQRSAGNAAVNRVLRHASLQRCAGGDCHCENCASEHEVARGPGQDVQGQLQDGLHTPELESMATAAANLPGAEGVEEEKEAAPTAPRQGVLRQASLQRCADGKCGCEKCAEEEEEADEVKVALTPAQDVQGQMQDGLHTPELESMAAAAANLPGAGGAVPGAEGAVPGAEAEGDQAKKGEPAAPLQRSLQRAIAEAAHARTLQRVATWSAGPVHQVNNLASAVMNGTPAGVTWPTLNGTIFWSNAAARGALVKPTVKTTAVGAAFEAEVDNIPTNLGSYDETVLAAGPWTTVVPRATIATRFPALAQCSTAGTTTFRAIGDPNDGAMHAANRRHEDKHATDHRDAFNATILPWDTKLATAKAAGTKFAGATAAAAEAALWAHMGGTPDQIADAFMARCAAAVVAYHGSAAGGPIGAPTGPAAAADCSTSSANYTNPS